MHTTENTTFSPGVLSLLPLFYIGWSDSVLSPSEMKLIHKKLSELSFLTTEDKEYLIKHTNPQFPPSDELYKEWSEAIKSAAVYLPRSDKRSLAQLGLEMARSSKSFKNEHFWHNETVLKALEDIEENLGVNTLEDLQAIGHVLDKDFRSQIKSKASSFEPNDMRDILWASNKDIKQKTTELLRDPVFVYEPIQDKETHRQKVLDLIDELCNQGYGALAYDPRYGGHGDMKKYMAVFEILAQHDLSLTIKFGVQFGLFGGAVSLLGTEKHHKKYVEAIGLGKLLGCFAMTETGHGSNVKSLETTLTYDHESKQITVHSPSFQAGKEYIGNALHGSMAVVFGQLLVDDVGYGIHAVLVPLRNQEKQLLNGVKITDCGYKIGLNGVDNGRIWFDQVRVPVENLLDKYGGIDENGTYQSPIANENRRFFTMLGTLVGGRICVGAAGLSAGKVALDIAVRYALKRRQFGPDETEEQLIMDYPSHQARLTPLLVKTYAYHFALDNLRDNYVNAISEQDTRKIETKAAGLKAKATWLGMETIQTCREACGGKGYLSENRFGELKADADIFTTFEGDNTVLMQLVSKGLLTEFKQSFHDDGFTAVMRYIFGKVSFVLSEINPYQSRNTSIEHLTSDEFHADTLRYREKKVLMSLSERMRDYLKKRVSPYDAFLKCQNHMIYLAHAYVDRLVYRELVKKLDTLPSSPSKDMLATLTKYYALHNIYENREWYLENGYFEGSKTKAIRRVLNKMTQELRPELLALVDGFAITDESRRAEVCGFSYE